MQEVDYHRFAEDLAPELLKRGYLGVMQKPKKKAADQQCGVATFWKDQTFRLTEQRSFSRTMCIILERRNAEAEQDQQHQRICITNVHLESAQSELGSDRRARQLNSALAYAATTCPDAPLVVCGDCNTGADSQLFHVLRAHCWHGHTMSSVYEHPSTAETFPVNFATFMMPGHHYVIDHMLYSQDRLSLKGALDALSKEQADQHVVPKGIECGFPSDHIPIGGVFEILPPTPNSSDDEEVEMAPISPEREAELTGQWEALLATKPPHRKGKPSAEQIEERRGYAATVKEWKQSFQGNP